MKKSKKYKYQGLNGTIISNVLLEGINKVEMYELVADKGMILTDGNLVLKKALVLPGDLSEWSEIEDKSDK